MIWLAAVKVGRDDDEEEEPGTLLSPFNPQRILGFSTVELKTHSRADVLLRWANLPQNVAGRCLPSANQHLFSGKTQKPVSKIQLGSAQTKKRPPAAGARR